MPYGMYPLPAMNLNGVSSNGPSVPSVIMLYPLDHNASSGSHSEQLEFGSLGPVAFSGMNEQSQSNEGNRARSAFEVHRYDGSSMQRSLPDQPSSPPPWKVIGLLSALVRNTLLSTPSWISFPIMIQSWVSLFAEKISIQRKTMHNAYNEHDNNLTRVLTQNQGSRWWEFSSSKLWVMNCYSCSVVWNLNPLVNWPI